MTLNDKHGENCNDDNNDYDEANNIIEIINKQHALYNNVKEQHH